MKRYKSHINPIFLFVWFALLVSFSLCIYLTGFSEILHAVNFGFIIQGLILSILFESYTITASELRFKKPFQRITIPLSSIRKVETVRIAKWRQILTGMPAKVLLIRYNTFDDIYMSPKHLNEMLRELQNAQKISGITPAT